MTANGSGAQTVSDIKSLSLNSYSVVFVCLGVFPNNYVLKSDVNATEISKLIAYLQGGGRVYLEGGDTWARDFPTALHSFFAVHGEADGADDLGSVLGVGCLSGYRFSYTGANQYIDRLAPLSGAGLFFVNEDPAYGCGVAYDNGVYRTIGVSFEFGGLSDGASNKAALMGEILDFFSSGCSLCKPMPIGLQAFSGYDGAVPLMWDPPPGQVALDTGSKERPPMIYSSRNRVPLPVENSSMNAAAPNASYRTLGYNIYRASSAGGPFTKIAANIARQYYRDTTVSNGIEYFYAVTSVYSGGESPLSPVVSATPVGLGNVIRSAWAFSLPTLDGRLDAGEWASARAVDIRNVGQSSAVTLYVMNRTNYLYLAVDLPADVSLSVDDQIGLFIDQNRNQEWSTTLPYEGTFWAYWNGSSLARLFRPLSGWWPQAISWQDEASTGRLSGTASTASGHVQYELRLDLSSLGLTPPNPFPLRFFLYVLDQPSGILRGCWPTAVLNTAWQDAWLAPVIYGTLELATTETCEQWSETQAISAGGTYSFHVPGDGHGVIVQVTSLSGAGSLTVVQNNCPYPNAPGANPLPLYWTLTPSEGIQSFTANVTFFYTDADAQGFQESQAFWGVAGYAGESKLWTWKGGTIDAEGNRVTISGLSRSGIYLLYRRLFGDWTGDGYVDLSDFQAFGDVWSRQTADEFTAGSAAAFFNYDKNPSSGKQVIDLGDFQIFGDMWNKGIQP